MQSGLHVEVEVCFAVVAFGDIVLFLTFEKMSFFLDQKNDLLFFLFLLDNWRLLCIYCPLDNGSSLGESLIIEVGCLLETLDFPLVIAETEFASWTGVLEQ